MKLSVLQQDLLPALTAVSRSSGIRSSLPVLGNILLSADGSRLKIAATNLEIGIIKYTPAQIVESGEITVPAKTITEIVSSLAPAKMEIETKAEALYLSEGKFKAQINGIAASEFPVIPLSEGEGVKFKKDELVSASSILFAAAVDEGRPILTGILTQAQGGLLDFVATDGFRLAHRQVKLASSKSNFRNLIPRRTFEEVLRVISEDLPQEAGNEEQVEIQTSSTQNQVIFNIGQTIISSRLIEGKFPAWENIIPSKIVSRALLEKEELLKAVKLAAVFAKTEANIITLHVNNGKIIISSEAKELGSQENEVEGQIEGETLQIAFNAKFLMDALSVLTSTQLMIEFSGPLSPALIKPVGIEGLQYIIMPVKLT